MPHKKVVKTKKKSSKKRAVEKNINVAKNLSFIDELLLSNEKIDLNKSHMVTIKTSLQSVVRKSHVKIDEFGKSFQEILDDTIDRVNKIVFQTYAALKAYYLFKIDKNNKNLTFNVQAIRDIMNIITYKKQKKGNTIKETDFTKSFQEFFDNHYKKIMTENDFICRDNLKRLLNYEEDLIITAISNNIQEHFMSHLRFVIMISFGFKEQLDKLKNSKKYEELSKLRGILNQIVNDIIDVKNRTILSDEKYHKNIILFRDTLLPVKASFEEDSVPYDVKANPFHYFPQMVELNRIIEEHNNIIIANHTDPEKKPILYRLFNAIPLRTEIVPKNITIDTPALISMFIKKNQLASINQQKNPLFRKNFWNKLFKLESKSFRRKGYKFGYMIKTDGVSCSLIFHKTDQKGIVLKKLTSVQQKNQAKERKKIDYIEEAHITKLMKWKEVVTIDPNKYDMISAMKKITVNGITKYIYFNYTRGQRNKDCKKNKHDKKRKILLETKINNKSIQEIQSELASYNHKTCDFEKFLEYQKKKLEINRILYDHYKQEIYRTLNFRNYVNTKRSESLMLNRFKSKMGSPDKILIILGDYSDTGLRGTPPSITIKLRKLFKDAGYDVFLIDEYNTSKTCSHCSKKVESFIEVKRSKEEWKTDKQLRKERRKKLQEIIQKGLNLVDELEKTLGNIFNQQTLKTPENQIKEYFTKPLKEKFLELKNSQSLSKPLVVLPKETPTEKVELSKKAAKNQTKWKLLRCTSCKAIHNRDHNATKNMMIITESVLKGKGRPKPYERPKKD